MAWQKLYNPIVKSLLRSPLNGMLGSTMLLTFTGRKSGTQYTTPVDFFRDGDDLLTISQPDRHWWKNLVGGGAVTLEITGDKFQAVGATLDDIEDRKAALLTIARQSRGMASYLGLSFDEENQLTNPSALDEAAQSAVIVRFTDVHI